MRFILLVLTTLSFHATASVSCHDGAMSEAFGLFQSKNVCNHKTLERIYTTFKRTKENCESGHKNYNEFVESNCQLGDDFACGKAKRVAHFVSKDEMDSLKLQGRNQLQKRFSMVISKIQHTNESLKLGGRSIASIDQNDFTVITADCEDAFKTFSGEMQAWREEHPVVRKRSIRAR